ncbi:asparagine synthase (glutamine-hydrolyzing) [Bradyrhizobium sp. th.b2]|uniref:asparagine synthase (glutamine-hydrolyzing) n=1 Tax=Bradyrhizobium sp. th-b2 TaxID=172088 RepID=UPI00041DFE36|nr:asparagine synthase (glutamine-hydrolyzing) [Bradyrhizobium sp. th.b2]
MCGIFASIGFEPQRRAIDIVAHRGPDGSGWETYESSRGPVALGHRRLAIIDLSDHALQPMADATGRWHLTFNGEIYNYRELREELRSAGAHFSTESDSEVLLQALIVWGEATALPKLRGMFAFVLWDNVEKRLIAARDRFGIKPLYWVETAQGVAFASEIKQLLELRHIARSVNFARVHDFLLTGMADHTSETMFAGIRQLRGGECAMLDASTASIRRSPVIRAWYAYSTATISIDEGEAAKRFKALLTDAVSTHLRSDVPLGSCLSGGLDSSSIVCLMSDMLGSRKGGPKVETVSACYGEKSVDEKPFMDEVVRHAATQPHFIYPRVEEVFARASDIAWHQDEPFGSTSIFAQWCVFEEAKRAGLKVMLDGQGADEQLAGYHGCYYYYLDRLSKDRQIGELLAVIWDRRRKHRTPLRQQFDQFVRPLLSERLRRRIPAAPPTGPVARHYGWLDTDIVASAGNPTSAMATAVAPFGLEVPHDIKSFCFATAYASNLQLLLHWEDRNSMAHSIEARVPFVDHPLIEFSLSLGDQHKMVRGTTKKVLRRAMRRILPDKITDRHDKLGFATPEEIWFKGILREPVIDGVEATLRRFPGLMDPDETRALVRDSLDGRRPFDFAPWRIVSLGQWGERFAVSL